MVDIEKVKNGLQCCAVGAECDHCRYSLMNNSNNGRFAGCYQLHNDALVLVEEQQAEIERLKEKQPKWIPSSERLPEMFEDVLVYGSFGYEIMHIEDANYNGGVEWCNDHDYFVPVCDTIWIALSELYEYVNADRKDGEHE